jgi:hypothetical protein
MRSKGQCPRCASRAVGLLHSPFEYLYECDDVCQPPRKSPDQWRGQRRLVTVVRKLWWRFAWSDLRGEIRGTICRACGYLEQHLRDPDRLSWDAVAGLRWLRGDRARCDRCGAGRVCRIEAIGPPDARIAMTKERAARSWEQGFSLNTPRDPGYVGQLGAELCAACGFFVVFVNDPDTVPWDELAGFSMT